jgi:hypothetical protein
VPCLPAGGSRGVSCHRASQPEADPSAGAQRPYRGALVSRLGDCRLVTPWLTGCGAPTPLPYHCWVDVRPVNWWVTTGRAPRCPAPATDATYGARRGAGRFTRRGSDATSVAELAAATGMSKAAVSYHFPTKNDLLHALAEPLLDSPGRAHRPPPDHAALARWSAGPARGLPHLR